MTELNQEPSQVSAATPTVNVKPSAFPAGDTVRTFTFDKKRIEVADPYAALEENSAETLGWVKAQNDYARTALKSSSAYPLMLTNLTQFTSQTTVDAPLPAGAYLFSKERLSGEEQPSFIVRSRSTGELRKLVDPNKMEGKFTIDSFFPSPDGKLVIVGLSQGGTEASVLRILDTSTGQEVSPRIPRANWASVAWQNDGSGFYFTQYPAKGTVKSGEENYHRKIFFTEVGSPAQTELNVLGQKMQDFPSVYSSTTRPWLTFSNNESGKNSLTLKSLVNNKEFTIAKDPPSAAYDAIFTPRGLGVRTTADAPNGKFIEFELPKNGLMSELARPKEIIPERKDMILKEVHSVDGRLLAHYSDNLKSRLIVFDEAGKQLREVTLPSVGTVTKITAGENSKDSYVQFTSFTSPPQVLKLDVQAGTTEVFSKVDVPFDASKYQVSQIWATSKDKTKVPAFVIEPKGAVRNSNSPTLLIGYGGFNISQLSSYSALYASWVAQGGTVVVANLRGGGEFGDKWHEAGMLGNKQNVFDDYIAVAKQVIKEKISSPDRLAAYGGSNGGLLVTAVLNQKPELFGAAAANVPLTDMLRYDQSKIAKYWVSEYGSASNSERELRFIKEYSPYHNISSKKSYPPMIVTNGENDPRVDPIHARKYFAELISKARLRGPAYLLTNFNSGHGVGESRSIQIDNTAQTLGFLWDVLTKK